MYMERVLKDDAIEDKSDRASAPMAQFARAMAIADLMKTTFGPKGMNKIRGRDVTATNDGAIILKSLHIDNPDAKVPGETVTTGLNVEAKKKKRRGKKNKKNRS